MGLRGGFGVHCSSKKDLHDLKQSGTNPLPQAKRRRDLQEQKLRSELGSSAVLIG